LESIASNLARFNEDKTEESEAVHKSFNIIEAVLEAKPDIAKYIGDNTKILTWCVQRLSPQLRFDDNKLYASEILAMLMQQSKENQFTLGKSGGIEQLLFTLVVTLKKLFTNLQGI